MRKFLYTLSISVIVLAGSLAIPSVTQASTICTQQPSVGIGIVTLNGGQTRLTVPTSASYGVTQDTFTGDISGGGGGPVSIVGTGISNDISLTEYHDMPSIPSGSESRTLYFDVSSLGNGTYTLDASISFGVCSGGSDSATFSITNRSGVIKGTIEFEAETTDGNGTGTSVNAQFSGAGSYSGFDKIGGGASAIETEAVAGTYNADSDKVVSISGVDYIYDYDTSGWIG